MKKILSILGGSSLVVFGIGNLVSTTITKKTIEETTYELPMNDVSMSEVSVKLERIFNGEQRDDFELSPKIAYSESVLNSDVVFENIKLNQVSNELVVDIEAIKMYGENYELFEILESEEFFNQINTAYEKGLFRFDDTSEKIYFYDELEANLEIIDTSSKEFNLNEQNSFNNFGNNDVQQTVNKFVNGDWTISDNDFWTESRWYWFGFKIFQMTNRGRIWLVNKSNIINLQSIQNSLEALARLVARELLRAVTGSTGSVHLFLTKIALLVVNVILMVTCLSNLSKWNNVGASIKYMSLTGTIVWWNKR